MNLRLMEAAILTSKEQYVSNDNPQSAPHPIALQFQRSLKQRISPFGDAFIPTLQSYRIAWNDDKAPMAWLESIFAAQAIVCSHKRRMNDKGKDLALDAARGTIKFGRIKLVSIADREGLRIIEPEGHGEALAREIAESFPNSEPACKVVLGRLWYERAAIFANSELTLDDPNIHIATWHEERNRDPEFFEMIDPEYRTGTEPVSVSVGRTLDYIEHLKNTNEYRKFFSLKRHLTAMWRVGEVILGRDF